jgi:uncharacterized membrane protein
MDSPLAQLPWQNIHPILVNFTAALVPVSVVSDLSGKVLGRESLKNAAWWSLCYAAAITPFTAAAGWLWRRSIEAALSPDLITLHQRLGVSLAVAFVALTIWRGLLHRRGETPGAAYFLLAAVILGALMYQGHLGGSMTFG